MCNKAIGYCDGSCKEAKEYWKEQKRLEDLARKWNREESDEV